MIGGLVEHDGDRALAFHLAKVEDNEIITVSSEGLSARGIGDALDELNLMALGCRSRKPLLHVWASPSRSYSDHDRQTYWSLFEVEYGLEGHPYLEVRHQKLGAGGRTAEHTHRVYLRIDHEGKAVRTNHSAARQEKISRMAEYLAGERFTAGCFNDAVIERLRTDGREDIADAMVAAGLGGKVANTAPTSAERAMAERLGDLAPDEVWRRAAISWARSDSGASFLVALAETGLHLAMGSKCAVLVSPAGAVHPLLRALNKGGERLGSARLRKRDVDLRLRGVILPPVSSIELQMGFAAGPFSIINLDRLPVLRTGEPELADQEDHGAPLHLLKSRPLSAQQEAALLLLDDAPHVVAAEKARAARAAIEREVEQEVLHKRLRDRVRAETASWEAPGIGLANWRDAYRAELAGLPKGYGPYLRWVEKLDADRRRVILRSGTTVILEPRRGSTDKTGADAVAVLVEHARTWKCQGITIAGDQQWRRDAAVAATRAGLAVVDADLRPVVEEERSRILLEDWWKFRQIFQDAPPEQRHQHTPKLLAHLETISRTTGIRDIVPEGLRRMLDDDVAAYERYSQALEKQLPRAGP